MRSQQRRRNFAFLNLARNLLTFSYAKTYFREGHLNFPRFMHGIGIVTINDEEKLAVFGGLGDSWNKLDNVEFYDTKTKTWETSDITLKEPNWAFASLTFKPSDLKLTKNNRKE